MIKQQKGMVLVTTLLLLVVVTLLAVSLFRSFGVDERIAGNLRDKQRALNAAETAEQFAESWLAAGNGTTPVTCTAWLTFVATNSASSQVCSNTLASQSANPAVLPWPQGVNYTPTNMTVTTTPGVDTYYKTPGYFVAFLGTTTVHSLTTSYYQIDAVGYGGNPNTAAVVEATYQTQSASRCASC
jgi:type IV pilus assembly protein PilX